MKVKIGELARMAGCQTVTIRYYEKEGLLPAPERSGGNYRLYDETQAERLRCREAASIEEDDGVEGLYFITSLPWLHYTQLIQPTAGGDESNPRISWGKYAADFRGRLMMPVTLLVHHALVDGMHLARFYQALDGEMAALVAPGDGD